MSNLIGQSLGRYHILEQLGEGGMAIVYKAYDTRLESDVAVKVIRTERLAPEILQRAMKRFEREAKSLAQLTHPNLVKVLDYGEYEGQPYLVMPYLMGGTLKQKMKNQPMPWQEAARLLMPIARALDYAHKRNLIHRDVKPSNILITESGEPMLTDFGVAKIIDEEATLDLTGTSAAVGTPEYMAPEQATSKNLDHRADIYALGIVFYEMVTGRRPFQADTPLAVLFKHASEPLPRPTLFVSNLPDSVEKILVKALAKNPNDRYQSMGEMGHAMESLVSGVAPMAKPQPEPVKPQPAPVKPKPAPAREKTRDTLATVDQTDTKATVDLNEEATVEEKSTVGVQKPVTKTVKKSEKGGILRYWPVAVGGLVVCILLMLAIIPFLSFGQPSLNVSSDLPTPASGSDLNYGVTGEVTIWHAYSNGSAEQLAFAKVLEYAKMDMPNVTINVVQVPFNAIYNKYRTDVASGGGPDMFIAPNDSLGYDAQAGLIADITYLANGRLDDYTPLSIDGMNVDGKLYGIPESMKAVAFWYNKSLLPNPPTTTDELKALMEGGTEVALSYGCYHHFGFFEAFGGKIFDPNWKIIADQTTGVSNAMAYLNDLYQISKSNGWPQNDSDGLAPFTEGKAAAITNGNWAMGDYYAALGHNLGVVPLPSGPGGPARPFLGIDGFYFNPNSSNLSAALEVALYLTGPKAQQVMMRDAGHVPVNTRITVTDPLIQGLLDAFENGYVRPQVPQLGLYWSNFCGTDEVFERGTDPAIWVQNGTANANR